jgi:hypothetical protein
MMAESAGKLVYVRMSLVQAKPGNEAAVSKIEDDLMGYFAKQPGYIHGYQITGGDSEGRVGRLTLWQSDHDADKAAQTPHVLAQRSELLLLIEGNMHVEDSWEAREITAQPGG